MWQNEKAKCLLAIYFRFHFSDLHVIWLYCTQNKVAGKQNTCGHYFFLENATCKTHE